MGYGGHLRMGLPTEARGASQARRWAHQDSNLEQAGYEPAALTVELWARSKFTSLRRSSLQKRPELPAARRVAQLPKRLGFDLSDALARDRKALSHLFERMFAAIADAEAHL